MASARPDLVEAFHRQLAIQHLGLEAVEVGSGNATIRLPIKPELTVDGRFVIAGIVGTLVEYGGAVACASLHPEGWLPLGVSFTVNTVAPAAGDSLRAVGRAVGGGDQLSSAIVEVYADRGDDSALVATGTVVTRVVPFEWADE